MEEIMTEKVAFLKDNKDALINHVCSINYPLVKILVSDQSLEELDEYNQILDVIENTEIKESDKEVKDIIYYLVGISNKLGMYNSDFHNMYSFQIYFVSSKNVWFFKDSSIILALDSFVASGIF